MALAMSTFQLSLEMKKKSKLEGIKDADFIVIAALRYTLGRSSYAVSIMQDFIRTHWNDPVLVPKHEVFIRDIKDHIDTWEKHCASEHEKYQMQTWKNLLTELEWTKQQ